MTDIASSAASILPSTRPDRPSVVRPDTRFVEAADSDRPEKEAKMRALAKKFEASFLAEMLKHAGLGEMPEQFNGGAGEAAYSGFLVQEYADKIAETGRIGIADNVYAALKARSEAS